MIYEPGFRLLEKYEFVKLLGTGGWGNVYKAIDLNLRREVAIKHLKADSAKDKIALKRFLREAETIAAFNHPNIVMIYAFEEVNNNHYIVMEYAQRGTLEDLLSKTGPLAIGQVFDLTVGICDALKLVHSREIIHRDIKPSNILLFMNAEDRLIPKLADFGLARTADRLTEGDNVLGTVAYMSPEQGRGEEADMRSDIYSLGVLIYKALTGRLPYEGTLVEMLNMLMGNIERKPPVPVSEIREDVSDTLNQLVMKAISLEPEKRFQSLQTMSAAFQTLKGEISVTQKPEELEKLYEKGVEHSQHEEWSKAVSSFGQIIKQVPDYKDAGRKWEEARQQDALRIMYEGGLRYFEQERWQNAAASFKDVVATAPDYKDAGEKLAEANRQINLEKFYEKAIVAFEAGLWSDAVSSFEEIINLDKDYRDAVALRDKAHLECDLKSWYREGFDHYMREGWHAAMTSFKKIREVRSDYRDVDNLYEKAQQQSELEDMYKQAQEYEVAEQWEKARDVYGQILSRTNYQYKDADKKLADINGVIRVEDNFKEAQTAYENKNWTLAANLLEQLLEQEPDHQKSLKLLAKARDQWKINSLLEQAKAYEKAEEWDEVVTVLTRISEYDLHSIHKSIVDLDYDDISKLLEQARRKQRMEELYEEGRQYLHNREYRKALRRFNQVLDLDPNHQGAVVSKKEVKKLLIERKQTNKIQLDGLSDLVTWWRLLGGATQAAIIVAIISLIGTVYSVTVGPFSEQFSIKLFAAETPISLPTATPTSILTPAIVPEEIFYFVHVMNEVTREDVSTAEVTIEISGKSPLNAVTDSNGIARIVIDASYVGKPGFLIVKSRDYETHTQNIDVKKDALPDIILLVPES